MKRVKQLTFKSWTLFREWYLRMKETFTDLSVTFLKVMNKKSSSSTYFVVITY
jgi:hypothetical protein